MEQPARGSKLGGAISAFAGLDFEVVFSVASSYISLVWLEVVRGEPPTRSAMMGMHNDLDHEKDKADAVLTTPSKVACFIR